MVDISRHGIVSASEASGPTSSPSGRLVIPNSIAIFKSEITVAYLHAGDYMTVSDPGVMLTTILGSCVSACVLDPVTGIGGMNHFVLPRFRDMQDAGPKERYGEFAMRSLVDAFYALGAKRGNLQARLFGGAKILYGGANIGAMNEDFALRFLRDEKIEVIGGSCGGDVGRRVKFHPATGKISQTLIPPKTAQAMWPQLLKLPKFAPLRPIRIDAARAIDAPSALDGEPTSF